MVCSMCLVNVNFPCLQARLVSATEGMVLEKLEDVRARLCRAVWQHRQTSDRMLVLQAAEAAVRDLDLM